MNTPQIRTDDRGGGRGGGRGGVSGGAPSRVRRALRARDDRGQAAVEFTGLIPLILITAILLWQAALVGYTFSLAGNAADEAVRAGTVAEAPQSRTDACREAGEENLPDAWSADINCSEEGDLVKARVDLDVPLLFPGSVNFGLTVPGRSATVRES
ncbi:TadE/TadG family type IV pilus assembly protein [Streptomyces niveus]|uniref:TadE/TadG family type IV pilus assembly protein n=1 Tax=Streptomyces niveus TaxID=193462 RepID=UPI003654993B